VKSVVGSLLSSESKMALSLVSSFVSPFLERGALRGASQFRDTKRFGSIESELLRALLVAAWRFLQDSEEAETQS